MKFVVFAAALLLLINPAAAQPAAAGTETAIVTATLSKQLQRETGRNIIVIPGSRFKDMPVNSVDELLRYAAGIEVQQRGPQGAQSDLLIRGGTFQQVLIIIDNIRLNDPLTGHFNGNIPIHPFEIERIEVLKGPASALYGPEAVGGVIHIITRAFDSGAAPGSRNVHLGMQLGEYGLRNFNAYAAVQKEQHYFSLGAFANFADGPRLKGTKGFFNLNTINAAYGGTLGNNWRLSARAALDFRKFNAQNFYTTFASDTANEAVNSQFAQLNLRRQKGARSFSADVAYKFLKDEFQFAPLSTSNFNRTRQFIAQMNYGSRVDDKTSLVTGMQLFNRVIRSNDRGNHGLWHAAAWVGFQHKLGSHVFLNESARFDWDESYGLTVTPQINLSYAPSKWSFRFSAGRGIRDADFTERYNNYQKTLVTGGRIGNPDLNTENTWSVEAGFDYLHQPDFKVSGSVFYRNQNDLIDWKPTPYAQMPRKVNLVPSGNYALASNVEQVKTYGAELDLMYQKQLNNGHRFLFTSGITLLQSENDDSIPSFYISSHAKLLCNFGVRYAHPHFNIALNGLYKQRDEQNAPAINAVLEKDYFLINLRADARIFKGVMTVFAQAHNLFNTQYSDLLGARMPGRWLSGGINLSL